MGIVILWGGYSVFVWGLNKFKIYGAINSGASNGSGTQTPLTFSDCVLPSRRTKYVEGMLAAFQKPYILNNAGQVQTLSQTGQ